jgi:hypothetical protein
MTVSVSVTIVSSCGPLSADDPDHALTAPYLRWKATERGAHGALYIHGCKEEPERKMLKRGRVTSSEKEGKFETTVSYRQPP